MKEFNSASSLVIASYDSCLPVSPTEMEKIYCYCIELTYTAIYNIYLYLHIIYVYIYIYIHYIDIYIYIISIYILYIYTLRSLPLSTGMHLCQGIEIRSLKPRSQSSQSPLSRRSSQARQLKWYNENESSFMRQRDGNAMECGYLQKGAIIRKRSGFIVNINQGQC